MSFLFHLFLTALPLLLLLLMMKQCSEFRDQRSLLDWETVEPTDSVSSERVIGQQDVKQFTNSRIPAGVRTNSRSSEEIHAVFMDQQSVLLPSDDRVPFEVIGRLLLRVQDAVSLAVLRARRRAFQGFMVFSVIFLLLFLAAFSYGSFYYTYMPNASFSVPVYYYHRTDCEASAPFLCSYPVANISLMKNKRHVLTFGQAYQISLQLEMPDSPTNHELGMFMIKTTCFSHDGGQLASSARSTRQLLSATSSRFGMLRYQSSLLKTLGTLLFLPAFLSGASEQKQVLEVELFSDYTDDPYSPSSVAVIEILSNKVQIYASQLNIHAYFTGLRYLLFYFPLLSALVGVASNFIFLSLLFIFSYTRLLLRVDWKPEEPTTNGQQSEVTEITNDQQEDESQVTDATQIGPLTAGTHSYENNL